MMGSRKQPEAQSFRSHRQQEHYQTNPVRAFEDMPRAVKEDLKAQLCKEQRGLCVYCGQSLEIDQNQRHHVEHFRPQTAYPDEACDHDNLFLSCGPQAETGTASWCGQKKGGDFDEDLAIYPEHPTCTSRFVFKTKGKVVPADSGDEAAKHWIEELNLNHIAKVRERRTLFFQIDAGQVTSVWRDRRASRAIGYGHVAATRLAQLL